MKVCIDNYVAQYCGDKTDPQYEENFCKAFESVHNYMVSLGIEDGGFDIKTDTRKYFAQNEDDILMVLYHSKPNGNPSRGWIELRTQRRDPHRLANHLVNIIEDSFEQ